VRFVKVDTGVRERVADREVSAPLDNFATLSTLVLDVRNTPIVRRRRIPIKLTLAVWAPSALHTVHGTFDRHPHRPPLIGRIVWRRSKRLRLSRPRARRGSRIRIRAGEATLQWLLQIWREIRNIPQRRNWCIQCLLPSVSFPFEQRVAFHAHFFIPPRGGDDRAHARPDFSGLLDITRRNRSARGLS
jgi:hypothetical protein